MSVAGVHRRAHRHAAYGTAAAYGSYGSARPEDSANAAARWLKAEVPAGTMDRHSAGGRIARSVAIAWIGGGVIRSCGWRRPRPPNAGEQMVADEYRDRLGLGLPVRRGGVSIASQSDLPHIGFGYLDRELNLAPAAAGAMRAHPLNGSQLQKALREGGGQSWCK